jgi:hypothetical protein
LTTATASPVAAKLSSQEKTATAAADYKNKLVRGAKVILQLEQDHPGYDDIIDLTGYSLKFEKCQYIYVRGLTECWRMIHVPAAVIFLDTQNNALIFQVKSKDMSVIHTSTSSTQIKMLALERFKMPERTSFYSNVINTSSMVQVEGKNQLYAHFPHFDFD